MAETRPLMFHRLARYYDALVAEKDSRSEAERLEGIARRLGRSRGRAWLDVACGTGRHLAFLRQRFAVTGIDLSPEMLRLARRRLPHVPLWRADMRTFRLDERFDVVSCLYSAIGHLRSERELGATFANLARHLKPGGVLIVEPWIDPSLFRPGYVHLVSYRSTSLTVVRVSTSSRRGNHSTVHYHYLIGRSGHAIEHVEEIDVGLLVPRQRLLELMRKTGLSARFVPKGLTEGRGLVVGIKRGASGPPRPTARAPRPNG